MTDRPNCEVTVHLKMKVELFCDLTIQRKLGYEEGQRFTTHWLPGWNVVELHPSDTEGRKWARKSAIAGGPLVGQSRLRLVEPGVAPAPRFQPIRKLPAWIGKKGGVLTLIFSRPLQEASKRAVSAYKHHFDQHPK